MKKFSLLLLFLFGTFVAGNTQSIENGIRLYEQGDFQRALRIFEQYDTPTSNLFKGKSYFSLGNFYKARHYLNKLDSTAQTDVYQEAEFTNALADFQLKNFGLALDRLYRIRESSRRSSVYRDAILFYDKLLGYLDLNQRLAAFKSTSYDAVRFDLLNAAVGRVEYGSALALYEAYLRSTISTDSTRLAPVKNLLSDSLAYWQRYNPELYPEAPDGISYNIGVALPEFEYNSQEYEISQSLYFGIQLAFEEFNTQNTDRKAFITFKNTGAKVSNAEAIVNDLVWNHDVDAIIGPLYSEVAGRFSELAETYEVPLLTPLANSDSLNLDLSYTFQLNPTFYVQGREMARFAVQNLQYDTLAVIAERGSLGEPSARAFREEALLRGATIMHFFVDDFESEGYDIRQYTEKMDSTVDTTITYNIDAIYAPFTGTVAPTLISSLLTDLEAMKSEMTILGSEEWETAEIEANRVPGNSIYYSKTFDIQKGNTNLDNFNSSYRLRFDTEPTRFSYIGYDAAKVLLNTLKKVNNPALLKKGLKSFNNYQGLSTNVSFKGTHINQDLKIKRLAGPEQEEARILD